MELKTKSKISSKLYNTITFHDFKPQSPRGRGFTRRGELKREGGGVIVIILVAQI